MKKQKPQIDKKLKVKNAPTYDEFLTRPATTLLNQLLPSFDENGCVKFNCVNPDVNSEYTDYSHYKKRKLFPSYAGSLKVALGLLLGDGFISVPKSENEKSKQPLLDQWLYTTGLTGLMNYEHIVNWIQEFIERKASLLYVNNGVVEDLKKERLIEVLQYDITDSETWNSDIAGIFYNQGELTKRKSKFVLDEEIKKQLIISKKTQKVIDDVWFISINDLVLLGDWLTMADPNSSILDSDNARQQYILETYRLAIDDVTRDKIPHLIFWTRDKTIEQLAQLLGVDINLLQTPNGKQAFLDQIGEKLKLQKDSQVSALPAQAGRNRAITVNGALFEKIEPVPTGSYLDDLRITTEMSTSVMANVLGYPEAILGAKTDQYATSYKALLQFTQDTLIVWQQKYLNIKLVEVAKKGKLKFDITISPKSFINDADIASIENQVALTGQSFVGSGVSTNQVYEWLNQKLGTNFSADSDERLISSQFQPLTGTGEIM
jgi:hypothetical protein